LRWVKRCEPETWTRAWKILTTTAYITYRLTGTIAVNHSDGGICLAYDLDKHGWSEELLSRMDLPLSVYGELFESDALVGEVVSLAATESGIPAGTPVVAGGEDTSSAGLAMGVFSSDIAQLSLGTANTVNVPMQKTVRHPRLLSFPHVIAGWTLIGGSMSSGGLAIQWITKLLCDGATQPDVMEHLISETDSVPPGADGLIFLPYLAGELQPINDGRARGVFAGLTAEMGRPHLTRAVLEGTAMAIEHNLSLARTVGANPRLLRAVGGPARSRRLCQIIADVVGLPIEIMHETAGAALGSAILAAQGLGHCSVKEMQQAHARIVATIEPDGEKHNIYRNAFEKYAQMYPRVGRADIDSVGVSREA
jgi:xylulokinase